MSSYFQWFKCVVFLMLIGISVSQNELESTTTELPDAVSEVICQTCNCTNAVIDCTKRDLTMPFELQDWEGVKDFQPITVDLSQNSLTSITRISKLPIQTLNISNCEIMTLEDASFVYLPELVNLDLSRNMIATDALSRRVFVGPVERNKGILQFSKIRYLSLAHNDIHSLPQDLFTFMASLTILDLSGNPLTFIDQVTMAAVTDLFNLRELYLSSCELESLPEGIFRRQQRLTYLDLSDNRFTTVPDVLSEASNLQYLDFSRNPIEALDKENAIKKLTNLKDLRLCRNRKLRNITAGALGGLPELVSLRICHNPRLTNVDPNFLASTDDHGVEMWPTLSELYLNNNNLSQIHSLYVHRWDKLTAVDVSGNPFICDCRNQWTVDVLVPLIDTIGTTRLAKNMVCKKPQEMRGLSFTQLHNSSKILECPESEEYTELPVPNLAILLGIMIGIFVTFPMVLVIVLLWRRGYFEECRGKVPDDEEDAETDAF